MEVKTAPEIERRGVATLLVFRRIVLAILLFAIVRAGAELLLMEHTEGLWQLAPVCLIAIGLVVVGWHAVFGSVTFRVLKGTMAHFGIVGSCLYVWLFPYSVADPDCPHWHGTGN